MTTTPKFQDKILEYLKNPLVCGLIIALATYYVYSDNYLTRVNIRERFPLRRQRTMNLKCCFYVFLITVVMMLIFRYAGGSQTQQFGGAMLEGYAPF